MKKLLFILVFLNSVAFGGWFSSDEKKEPVPVEMETTVEETTVDENSVEETTVEEDSVDTTNEVVTTEDVDTTTTEEVATTEDTEDANITTTESLNEEISTEDILNPQESEDMNTTEETEEEVIDTTRKFSHFEKTFVYHVAYNHYKKAIKHMYAKEHKEAYDEAIKAKNIFLNQKNNKIALPYMPGYVRENAQTPRRIYYKIIEEQNYELTRLIRKIKLLNPPIPMVILNQTSTYVDIQIQNLGDVPLDKFGIEINYEKIITFDKINPNETKTYRYNKTVQLEQLTFSEEYGFIPMPIEFAIEEGE